MPDVRQYPQADTLEATDALILDRLGVGTLYIEGENIPGFGSGSVTEVISGAGITTNPAGTITTTGTISLSHPIAIADGGVYPTSAPSSNVILLGQGGVFVLGSLEAGSGISITLVGTSLSIAATGGGGSGTVTSVSLSAPFGGGTVTSSGTLGTTSFTADGVLYGGGTGALGVTAVGTAGQVLTSNGTGVAPTFQAVAPGAPVIISKQTPSGVDEVSFTSIPQGYTHLAILYSGRTDSVGEGEVSLKMTFNSDTTNTHYGFSYVTTTDSGSSAVSASGQAGGEFILIGFLAGSTTMVNAIGGGDVKIKNYTDTNLGKQCNWSSGALVGVSSGDSFAYSGSGEWIATPAAITRIDIVTDDGSNFLAGTLFELYGVP